MRILLRDSLCIVLAAILVIALAAVPAQASELLQITGLALDTEEYAAGTPIIFTITTSGGSGTIEYGFSVYWGTDIRDETYEGSELVGIRAYSPDNRYTFIPDKDGIYFVHAFARDDSDIRTIINRFVVMPPLTIESVIPSVTLADVGSVITWTAVAPGGTGYEKRCQFIVYKDETPYAVSEDTPAPYDEDTFTFSYSPSEPGAYGVNVIVNAHTAIASAYSETTLVYTEMMGVSLTPDKTRANIGSTVTWTAEAVEGHGEKEYRFRLYKDGERIDERDYGISNIYHYTFTSAGTYTAVVHIVDSSNRVAMSSEDVHVATYMLMPLFILDVMPDRSTVAVGRTISWTAIARGGAGERTYAFKLYRDGEHVESSPYGTDSAFSHTPAEAGIYSIRAYVKDSTGTAECYGGDVIVEPYMLPAVTSIVHLIPHTPGPTRGAYTSLPWPLDMPVTTPTPEPKPTANPLSARAKASISSASIGSPVTVSVKASGGTGKYEFSFLLLLNNTALGGATAYSSKQTYSFTPKDPGTYQVRVNVKDGLNKVSVYTGNIRVK